MPPPHRDHPADHPAARSTTDVPAGETGVRAAWGYAQMMGYALYHPLLARLPALNVPTRVYLCANMLMYAAFALVFFAGAGHQGVARSGADPLLTAPLALVLWGATALVVCAAQVAVLVVARWFVWEVAAILTAMWASFLSMLLWIEALHALFSGLSLTSIDATSGAIWWSWVVCVHIILIRYRFVRVLPPETPPVAPPATRSSHHQSHHHAPPTRSTLPTTSRTSPRTGLHLRGHDEGEEGDEESDPILVRLRSLARIPLPDPDDTDTDDADADDADAIAADDAQRPRSHRYRPLVGMAPPTVASAGHR